MYTHLLAKVNSGGEAYGYADITLFELQGASLQVYSSEGVLDLENEQYMVSIFYLGRAQLLSRACCFRVSVYRGQTPATLPGVCLLGSISLLHQDSRQSKG